jgi:hypothetical protein
MGLSSVLTRRISIGVFSFAVFMLFTTFVLQVTVPLWDPIDYFYWVTIALLLATNLLIPFFAYRLARRNPGRGEVRRVGRRVLWGGAVGALISVLELTATDSKKPGEAS